MTAHEVLQEAQRRGIVLTPRGTAIRFRGPRGALSEELKRELVRHKPEIIVILEAGPETYPCSSCGQFTFAEADVLCYWCRRAAQKPHYA